MTELLENYLMYFLIPLWLCAGFADWFCHWRGRIEYDTGPKESFIHLLMLVEMGIPALAALFLEINALVLGISLVAFAAHEATALWDVSFAQKHRRISPIEQHIHSFLEVTPLIALSCMALLHWQQFSALLNIFTGASAQPADFTVRLKTDPLPTPYIYTILVVIALLQVLPYLQELYRGLRAKASILSAAAISEKIYSHQ